MLAFQGCNNKHLHTGWLPTYVHSVLRWCLMSRHQQSQLSESWRGKVFHLLVVSGGTRMLEWHSDAGVPWFVDSTFLLIPTSFLKRLHDGFRADVCSIWLHLDYIHKDLISKKGWICRFWLGIKAKRMLFNFLFMFCDSFSSHQWKWNTVWERDHNAVVSFLGFTIHQVLTCLNPSVLIHSNSSYLLRPRVFWDSRFTVLGTL